MTRHQSRWTIFHSGLAIVAIVAFAMIAQGCATRRDRSQEVGSTGDYLTQGRNYSYVYGYNPYNPYMIGDDPYWGWWYPAPIYYYSRGDGDNDRDDGNYGRWAGGHGGQHTPPLGNGTGTTPAGTASHPMPVAGIPHVSSAPAVASAPSGGLGNGGGFGRVGGFGGGGGFGRGHGGFGHR
jgi:hypothetical protein